MMRSAGLLFCIALGVPLGGCSSASPASQSVAGGSTAGTFKADGGGSPGASGGAASAGAASGGASGGVGGGGTAGVASGSGGAGGAGAPGGPAAAGSASGAASEGGAGGGSGDGGAASGAIDGASGGGPDAGDAGIVSDSAAGGWPAVVDYSAPGPFATTRENDTGPGGVYDILRPTGIGVTVTPKHPIISWANGTLYSVDDYAALLTHWASYGFVVIAAQTNTTAGGVTHKAGIDWLIAQNAAAGSEYFGVLDVTKIGAAGHSQGGGATIAAGANAPGPTHVIATLPMMPLLSFEADPTIVSRQVAIMFNINATMDVHDPTGAVADSIFAGAQTGELVQASFIGVHTDAMNVAMQGPTLAWFRLQLMGDEQARAVFYPSMTCGLCQNAAWQLVRYK